MSRRGNVFRLPMPPPPTGGLGNHDADLKAMHEHVTLMTGILNQALQTLSNRANTIQQTGAKPPVPVSGLSVAGKQGLFHLTWNRMKNVDGYVVMHATDTAMTQLIGRYNIPDGGTPVHQIPVGNAAVTGSFQVYAYQGPKFSEPSPVITATTLVYAGVEAIPPAPPLAPLHPKLSPIRNGLTL